MDDNRVLSRRCGPVGLGRVTGLGCGTVGEVSSASLLEVGDRDEDEEVSGDQEANAVESLDGGLEGDRELESYLRRQDPLPAEPYRGDSPGRSTMIAVSTASPIGRIQRPA